MRLTIIPSDKYISIDNQPLLSIQQDLSWIPSNIHAVQWYDTHGEIEYTDGSPNTHINELGIYEQAIIDHNNEVQRLIDEKYENQLKIDYWENLRKQRNSQLQKCDWTQIEDSPLTQEEKLSWQNYRQALRDLPANTIDPKNPIWPSL